MIIVLHLSKLVVSLTEQLKQRDMINNNILVKDFDKEIKDAKNIRCVKWENDYNIRFLNNIKKQIPLLSEQLKTIGLNLLNNLDVSFSDFYGNNGISVYLAIDEPNTEDYFIIRISNHWCNGWGNNWVLNIFADENTDFQLNSVQKFQICNQIKICRNEK